MKKNTIKLNEQQLRNVIVESIKSLFSRKNTAPSASDNNMLASERSANNQYAYQELPDENEFTDIDGLRYRINNSYTAPSDSYLFDEAYEKIGRVAQQYAWYHVDDFLKTHALRISKTMVFNAMHTITSFYDPLSDTTEDCTRKEYKDYLDNNAEHVKDIIGQAWIKWQQDGGLEKVIKQTECDYEMDNGHPFTVDDQVPPPIEDYLNESKIRKIVSESIKKFNN